MLAFGKYVQSEVINTWTERIHVRVCVFVHVVSYSIIIYICGHALDKKIWYVEEGVKLRRQNGMYKVWSALLRDVRYDSD